MKNPILSALIITFALSACSAPKDIRPIDLTEEFKSYGVEGCFIVYDVKNGYYTAYNQERCMTGFLPASTFKILNSLIILDTGAVSNTSQVIEWDGTVYSYENWNSDQTLASAFKVSAVWVFQELARKVGATKMLYYLNLCDYGNKNISAGVDKFWLEGNFRITPIAQVDFLAKLVKRELPFPAKTVEELQSIMHFESGYGYDIYAKTGFAVRVSPQIGWWIGFVDTPDNTYCFAVNIESADPGPDFAPARIAIAKAGLKKLGILP
ncbi:MAG: hypothetical protein A2Y33_14050 [Spirochaetes bacterium GWF1_51_8]|nr:MAG: hypothetical protein A2Y33_14050 [Spirochaetes bacterium GWF1_51_8]